MIIVRLSGGLGNQMFQYALGRSLAIKYNTELKLDLSVLNDRTPRAGATYRDLQIDVFNIQAKIAERKDIPFLYRQYFSGKLKVFIDTLRHRFLPNKGKEVNVLLFQKTVLDIGKNAYLDGHWNNEKYFIEVTGAIRSDFTLKDSLPEKSQILLNEIQIKNSLGVFVRRSDFIDNDFHGVLGTDYYNTAFEYVSNRARIEKVYVFSDDLDWCRVNLHFPAETVFVGNEYAGKKFFEGHLVLLSACKNFIIPNSSFAWWAVWLNQNPNKIVVAPKRWFFDKNILSDEVAPTDWIRL
jgi:hypothetical protein